MGARTRRSTFDDQIQSDTGVRMPERYGTRYVAVFLKFITHIRPLRESMASHPQVR